MAFYRRNDTNSLCHLTVFIQNRFVLDLVRRLACSFGDDRHIIIACLFFSNKYKYRQSLWASSARRLLLLDVNHIESLVEDSDPFQIFIVSIHFEYDTSQN